MYLVALNFIGNTHNNTILYPKYPGFLMGGRPHEGREFKTFLFYQSSFPKIAIKMSPPKSASANFSYFSDSVSPSPAQSIRFHGYGLQHLVIHIDSYRKKYMCRLIIQKHNILMIYDCATTSIHHQTCQAVYQYATFTFCGKNNNLHNFWRG